jgi:hypothetical protein
MRLRNKTLLLDLKGFLEHLVDLVDDLLIDHAFPPS